MKLKKIISIVLALAFIFTLASCVGKKPENTDPENPQGKFTFTKENYPKMGGSLANLPLGQAVTATVLGISREEADSLITFAGSTTDNYKAIIDGDFDILLAYEPSEEAKEYIKNSGEELEMTPIGIDALVFICSKDNSVQSLSTDEIKSIYKGETTNWKDLGGKDADIIAYQRNPDSGSQTLFDKLINLGDELMDPPEGNRIGTMIGLLEAVAEYENSENALGYTVYYYLTNMESDKLDTAKILAVDGIAPSNQTIGNGSYPLSNDFYVVIRASAEKNSPERILYNWICSEQGQQLVVSENYPVKLVKE
ncbi:MAG: substrate-binding domain-containing protein [Oscillospiraceae bacterium]|nr:substrate-binding domain-containing protein [Oscillospiraceae bacterium]